MKNKSISMMQVFMSFLSGAVISSIVASAISVYWFHIIEGDFGEASDNFLIDSITFMIVSLIESCIIAVLVYFSRQRLVGSPAVTPILILYGAANSLIITLLYEVSKSPAIFAGIYVQILVLSPIVLIPMLAVVTLLIIGRQSTKLHPLS